MTMKEKRHSEEIHDDAYYDQLIKQRIGEALRNQSKAEKLDLATLEAWVEADRQKRRARLKRGLAIACCFLIICCGTLGIKYAFDYDGTVAVAGKNDNKVNEKGKNVVVKPNEEGVDENTGVRKIEYDSLQNFNELKQEFPRLMKPNYLPEGYEFVGLSIEYTELMENYNYKYSNGKDQLEIKQVAGANTTVFSEFDRKLKCKYGDLLIIEDDGIAAGCKTEDGIIYILIKDCPDNRLIKIIDGIK